MARPWIRLYTEVLNNVKIQRLPDHLFKFLINCWCLTGESPDERMPPAEEISWRLHVDQEICTAYLAHLENLGLLDRRGDRYTPHNWDNRQFVSDDSKERVRKFRERQKKPPRNAVSNGHVTASVTAQDSDSDSDSEQTQIPDPDARARSTTVENLPLENGIGTPFANDFERCLKSAGWPLPGIFPQLCRMAVKAGAQPSQAAVAYMDIHARSVKLENVQDLDAYMITAFKATVRTLVSPSHSNGIRRVGNAVG